jgi:hypothetical protein
MGVPFRKRHVASSTAELVATAQAASKHSGEGLALWVEGHMETAPGRGFVARRLADG